MITVSSSDLPQSYVEAARVSRDAQRRYVISVKADLLLIVLGSLLSIEGFRASQWLAHIRAVIIFMSVGATLLAWKAPWSRVWFDARAVAESVKTLAWHYMSATNLFPKTSAAKEVDELFVNSVHSILNERKDIIERIAQPSEALDITPRMQEVRNLPSSDRRDTYLKCRMKDQQEWYNRKAAYNRAAKERLYTLTIVLQVFAFIASVVHLVRPETPINFTGFLVTLAAALLTWLQVRHHEELSQSYALAAQELRSAEALARYADSDSTLSDLVCEVERAISREHTLWVARRTCSETLNTHSVGRI